jgi:hypothetical protein
MGSNPGSFLDFRRRESATEAVESRVGRFLEFTLIQECL